MKNRVDNSLSIILVDTPTKRELKNDPILLCFYSLFSGSFYLAQHLWRQINIFLPTRDAPGSINQTVQILPDKTD